MTYRSATVIFLTAAVMVVSGCGGSGKASSAPSIDAGVSQAKKAQRTPEDLIRRCLADNHKYLTIADDIGAFHGGLPSSTAISKAYADVDTFKMAFRQLGDETNPTAEQRTLIVQDTAALTRLQQGFLDAGTGGNLAEALQELESASKEVVSIPPLMTALCHA